MKLWWSLFLLVACGCTTLEESRKLDHDDADKIAMAIETENIEALKGIFSKIPERPSSRNTSDQGLVNQAMQLVATKGLKCNTAIMDYLESIGGSIDFYHFADSSDLNLNNIPLCKDYLIRTHLKDLNKNESTFYMSNEKRVIIIKEAYIDKSYEYLVGFLNNSLSLSDKDYQFSINSYKYMIKLATNYGKEFCMQSITSKGCIYFGRFKKLPQELTEKNLLPKTSMRYSIIQKFVHDLNSML